MDFEPIGHQWPNNDLGELFRNAKGCSNVFDLQSLALLDHIEGFLPKPVELILHLVGSFDREFLGQ